MGPHPKKYHHFAGKTLSKIAFWREGFVSGPTGDGWIPAVPGMYKNPIDNGINMDTLPFPQNSWRYILTLQGTNISHLGKRKILFKSALGKGYVSFQEGIQFKKHGMNFACEVRSSLQKIEAIHNDIQQYRRYLSRIRQCIDLGKLT